MNDAAGPGENRAQLIRRCPGKQETLFSGAGGVRAHPHNTLRLCLCIQGLCGCPGNSAAAGTGGASPAKPLSSVAGLGVPMLCVPSQLLLGHGPQRWVWGQHWGGAPFWGVAGSSVHTELMWIFFGALCSVCEGKSCHFGTFHHPHIISKSSHPFRFCTSVPVGTASQ